jgi:hypothetical protein
MSIDMAVGVLLGVAFLYVFYRAVQADWPESYFGATDVSAYAVSMTPLHYALFRFLPLYATCVFVGVSLDRRETPGAVGALLVGVTHGALTLGRALVVWARSKTDVRQHRASIALSRAFVLVGVVVVAAIAAATRDIVSPIVPPLRELSAALWTAIFAGIAGAFLVRISRNALDQYGLVRRSFHEIPDRLFEVASAAAKLSGADEILVWAVMVVENVERPKWFRSLERLKARVAKHGTYGIMQVTSDRPLSDEESIQKTVAERLAAVNVRTARGLLDPNALGAFARTYNSNPSFSALLASAYSTIEQMRASALTKPT